MWRPRDQQNEGAASLFFPLLLLGASLGALDTGMTVQTSPSMNVKRIRGRICQP